MWTLLLSRQGDPPGTFIDRRQIDSGQIKVGRSAATCDLVVPDTAGHLSREHCLISAIGFDLFVVDTSTNGVALNQPHARIAPQTPVAVRVGDRLLLGDFAIEVATETAGLGAQLHTPVHAAPAAPSLQQPDAWFDAGGAAADPIWGTGASRAEVHEFLGDVMHDFLATPTRPGGGAGAAFDPFGGTLGEAFSKPLLAEPIVATPDAFAIPEDWAAPRPAGGGATPAALTDPFAGFVPPADDPFAGFAAPAPPADDPFAPPPLAGADPFAGIAPAGPHSDDPFAKVSAPAPRHDDPFAGFAKPASHDDDPFADFGAPKSATADPFAGFDAPAADPFAPSSPDAPAPDSSAPPRDATHVAPAIGAAPPAAPDWAAFCEGAGIDPADLHTSSEAMRRLGTLYRQVVLGLSDLIQDRAAFKDEFRVERTQLAFGRNNPLKHLSPLDCAKLLLADPLPGFMDMEEAVHAGLEDVKRHQLALLAGVQHALRAVFERLSPAEVERVMAKATSAKRGLLGRGVDPWSVYQTMWEALRTDAASNVNSVMSVAFREGYELFLKSGGKGAG